MSAGESHGGAARYVAIISDGSGRWAQARSLPVTEGHAAAADTVISSVYNALELEIEELTVYAFSTENWQRPRDEVVGLFTVVAERLREETPELDRHGVRVRCIGRRDGMPAELMAQMELSESVTRANDRIVLYIALNYGGRAEIVDAARGFRGTTEAEFRERLYAPEMHDPDVIIRTGGQQRMSNYLPWQAVYSELVFRDELWPDFSRASFVQALAEFSARQRRFGGR
jgi:undecaprenyl diphosphate synthase